MANEPRYTHAIDTSPRADKKCVCGKTFGEESELLDHVEGSERDGR